MAIRRRRNRLVTTSLPLLITLLLFVGLVLLTSLPWLPSARAQTNSTLTSQSGSMLYLDNGTVRVGLESRWGGAIADVSRDGLSFVNHWDDGREVQLSLYAGNPYPPCGTCMGAEGWNPVQGGDGRRHGSPVLAQTLGSDFMYVKTQPLQWIPDNKGGGWEKAVPADVTMEQWVSFVANYPFAVKVHYKITHDGTDLHANRDQEIPAVYINLGFDRFVYYGGTAPWTNAPVDIISVPGRPNTTPHLYAPEQWAAFVNDRNIGLAVYVPKQYPYMIATTVPNHPAPGSGTNYFVPWTLFTFGPNRVLEGDYYLFAGDYREARQAIYNLRNTMPTPDIFTPMGSVDAPARDSNLKGTIPVTGWAFDNVAVGQVDVFLDGTYLGTATYGTPRPDVAKKWPYCPTNIGFTYQFDTTKYHNGSHTLVVKARDSSGNEAVFPGIPISIQNPTSAKPD